MFTLILILFVTFLTLAAVLWVGTLFVQGYIYTIPSQQLQWQAPVVAAVMTLFFTVWCFAVVFSESAPEDVTFDTIFRFSPYVDLLKRPAKEMTVVKKNGEKVRYLNFRRGQMKYEYRVADRPERKYNPSGVEAVIIEDRDQKLEPKLFKLVKNTDPGAFRQFVSDDGWSMLEYEDGPSGIPEGFRFFRFVGNLFLNGIHVVLWFFLMWLVLRFQWAHAFGFAVALWFAFTLALLPMLLNYAAAVSYARRQPVVTAEVKT